VTAAHVTAAVTHAEVPPSVPVASVFKAATAELTRVQTASMFGMFNPL
jgi:hypothetical protein